MEVVQTESSLRDQSCCTGGRRGGAVSSTSSGYYPLINLPTRINGTSSTLIDTIYTNVIDVDIKNGIIINDISDHLPIYSMVKYSIFKNYSCDPPSHRNVRLLKDSNIEMLSKELTDIDWNEVTDCNEVDLAYSQFHCMFSEIFNKCCPIIQVKANYKANYKPLLTAGLTRL